VLLEQRTAENCAGVLAAHRTCAAGNYVLCDASGAIADVEVYPGVTPPFVDDHSDWIVHANHYQASDFWAHQISPAAGSLARLARMRTLIKEDWGRVTVETMKAALADHASEPQTICLHGDGGSRSIAGYIAEPARGLLHVRHGNGFTGTWQSYAV